jgi:sugar/nucleoside kinase (ribokinase family)
MRQAKRLGIPVSFTFSDPFLIDRFSNDFAALTQDYIDILFCNADEARQFCQTPSLEECGRKLGEHVPLVFMTNSEHGCYVIQHQQSTHVPGFVVQAIDTVGAGDAFAGGVLFGLARGNFLASRVVSISGPRLPESLRDQMEGVLNGSVS